MYQLFVSDMNETWIFFDRFSKNIQISNSMKIRPVGAELFYVDGKRGKTALFWFWTLEDGTIGCLETSVRNYQYLLRNSPEERSSRLLRGGSLKLHRYDEANSRTSQFCECDWKMRLNFDFWFITPLSNGWHSCYVFGCPAFMIGPGETSTLRLFMWVCIFPDSC